MNKKIFLACSSIIISLFVQIGFSNQIQKNHTVTYDEKSNNITIHRKGAVFNINLKSNPSTGYQWFLKSYPKQFIKLTGKKFLAPSKKLIGASGNEVWTFEVISSQPKLTNEAEIHFVYARPSDDANKSTELFFHFHTPKK